MLITRTIRFCFGFLIDPVGADQKIGSRASKWCLRLRNTVICSFDLQFRSYNKFLHQDPSGRNKTVQGPSGQDPADQH